MARAGRVSVTQNSATISIAGPVLLENRQSYACEDINLNGVKYYICEMPGDEEVIGTYIDFREQCIPTEAQPQSRTIPNLRPDTRYLITLRTEYSNGDCVESNPMQIKTQPYTGMLNN